MRRLSMLLLLMMTPALMAGCALYRNDKCYVPAEQYQLARDMFIQSGSLDLVERRLQDLEWQRCKVNETMYRLQKEFDVQPEEVAAPQAQPAAPAGK